MRKNRLEVVRGGEYKVGKMEYLLAGGFCGYLSGLVLCYYILPWMLWYGESCLVFTENT